MLYGRYRFDISVTRASGKGLYKTAVATNPTSATAAQEPTEPMFRFFVSTDCFVETCLVTDRFGASIPNSGCWPNTAARLRDVVTGKLTVALFQSMPGLEEPDRVQLLPVTACC